jgi:hypothetical protein
MLRYLAELQREKRRRRRNAERRDDSSSLLITASSSANEVAVHETLERDVPPLPYGLPKEFFVEYTSSFHLKYNEFNRKKERNTIAPHESLTRCYKKMKDTTTLAIGTEWRGAYHQYDLTDPLLFYNMNDSRSTERYLVLEEGSCEIEKYIVSEENRKRYKLTLFKEKFTVNGEDKRKNVDVKISLGLDVSLDAISKESRQKMDAEYKSIYSFSFRYKRCCLFIVSYEILDRISVLLTISTVTKKGKKAIDALEFYGVVCLVRDAIERRTRENGIISLTTEDFLIGLKAHDSERAQFFDVNKKDENNDDDEEGTTDIIVLGEEKEKENESLVRQILDAVTFSLDNKKARQ